MFMLTCLITSEMRTSPHVNGDLSGQESRCPVLEGGAADKTINPVTPEIADSFCSPDHPDGLLLHGLSSFAEDGPHGGLPVETMKMPLECYWTVLSSQQDRLHIKTGHTIEDGFESGSSQGFSLTLSSALLIRDQLIHFNDISWFWIFLQNILEVPKGQGSKYTVATILNRLSQDSA